jgi:hypothetical protein
MSTLDKTLTAIVLSIATADVLLIIYIIIFGLPSNW